MFIYESHMGGLFASEAEYDEDSLYCDTCGDSDMLIGEANNKEELLNLLKNYNYQKEYIDEFANDIFEECEKNYLSEEDIFLGMEINNVDTLDKIYNKLIIIEYDKISKKSKKRKGFIRFIGDKPCEESDKFIHSSKPYFVVYHENYDNSLLNSDDIKVNNHYTNEKIQYSLKSDKEMRDIGFTDFNKENWFFSRMIQFPYNSKLQSLEISFNVSLKKDKSDTVNIYVIDDDFCQPYDYQNILTTNPKHKVANIVREQVEFYMEYLTRKNILSGHNKGEYI